MKKFLIYFTFFINLITFAQSAKVEIVNNTFYVSVIDHQPKFNDSTSGNFVIRDYYEFTDPSKQATYKLPFKNIFLAIPANSIVDISDLEFQSTFEEKIIPALNPAALLQDSAITYIGKTYSEVKQSRDQNPIVKVEKYFWYREFYAVQLKINNYLFHYDNSTIEVFSDVKFRVNINPQVNILINSPLQIKSNYDEALLELLANSESAEQFRNKSTISLVDTTGNWIDYNSTYLKLGTGSDGIFRLTKSDLENQGINPSSIDPRTFKLFESGRELKILVQGEEDGIFDDSDFIEFYGSRNYPVISYKVLNEDNEDYNEYLNRYTDTTFYFLTWNNVFGQRIDSVSLSQPVSTDTLDYYTKNVHFENQSYFQFCDNNEVANQTPNWFKNKTWYWEFLYSQLTFNFNLNNIVANKSATLYAKLVSFASNIPTNSHQVTLSINNTLIDSISVDRYKQLLLNGNFNSSILINGNNQLKLNNISNGTDPNSLIIDWYEIEYPDSLKLVDDSINFKIPDGLSFGLKWIKIKNASNTEFRIYKIKPELKLITNYLISASTLFFVDSVSPGDQYYVIRTNKVNSPSLKGIKNFVNLRSITSQTDYIAITHPDFIPSVQNYIQTISSFYNLSMAAFNVFDIFDEFAFGYPYPEGIRLFLNVFYNNVQERKPQFLNLIGDSNYDYKYFTEPFGGKNFVTSFGNPVSDNWFTVWDLNGVPIPQLKAGRIPINNTDQLAYYLSKVENNQSKEFDDWNKRYLFFSGGIQENEYAILKSVNDTLINRLVKPRPIGGEYTHFYKTISPPSDFGPYTPDQFQNAIYNGALFISYIGHSGTATWDNSINETEQLYNGINRNPLITDFGCSTNKYAEPQIICFGERFLFNETGQALSYVGNSSLGFLSTAVTAPLYFYESITSDSLSEIGNANLYSKIQLFSQFGNTEVNRVFSLSNIILGDPAVRIKIPKLPNFIISASDIILPNRIINDNLDSVAVKIAINNFGLADAGSVQLRILQSIGSSEIKNEFLSIPIPLYSDTLMFWILTKEKPGNHTISINIDPSNVIEEMYEGDNSTSIQVVVAAGSLRDFLTSRFENAMIPKLRLLNPTANDLNNFTIETQISADVEFTNPTSILSNADTVITDLEFSNLPAGSRNYLRYRINAPNSLFSGIKSFYNEYNSKFLLVDSLSFKQQRLINLNWENDLLKIVPDTINISVLSAGWYAGATCVIAKDGINLLSNTFFAGMGIAVFDNVTLELDTVTYFQLFNEPNNVEALANLIDSIPAGKIVAIGVADDAANNISLHLKDAIKSLGSSKIDSLQFRGSWALIGWKGAPAGSVLEEVRAPLPPQNVFIDTSYMIQSKSGYFETNDIGPASKWKTVEIDELVPSDASSEYFIFGKRSNGQIDSLRILSIENGISDISDIDAYTYPFIILKGKLHVSSANISPTVQRISTDFIGTPELATNYQVVSSSADSVTIGEDIGLSFYVYNVGESKADSFNVKVEVINEDNSRQTIFTQKVDSLKPDERKPFELTHNTASGSGAKTFLINIDSDNQIRELFEDNNFFSVPFFIKPDTTKPVITLTIDGNDILDGEYVAPNPTIHIELNDESLLPITDPSSVLIYLNEELIPADTSIIIYQFSETNPKVTVDFTPVLSNGEYELKILWKDSGGNIVDSSGVEKFFLVSNEAKLLNVYNYPNPTSGETHFTFKLTQIPEEVKIKIFTIAGRLVKELELTSDELKYDFNKIYWDGRDEDGDVLSNGVYLYKVIMKAGEKSEEVTQKLAIVK